MAVYIQCFMSQQDSVCMLIKRLQSALSSLCKYNRILYSVCTVTDAD